MNLYSVAKHRRDITLPTDPATGFVFADVQNDARCTCTAHFAHICPRHDPAAYADMLACHATDSFPRQSDRAAEFHNSNSWGR